MKLYVRYLIIAVLLLTFQISTTSAEVGEPADSKKAIFVDVKTLDSSIIVEARYASALNFTGKIVPGYNASKCLLTREAADALLKAQALLKPMGLSIKTYDCYRPQVAVSAFMAWSNGKGNPRLKAFYYPNENIEKLVERGYIAEKSGHSRGSTIDLTIVPMGENKDVKSLTYGSCTEVKSSYDEDGSLNMGTSFDCFDEKSFTCHSKVPALARANRLLLKTVMEKVGFRNYEKEWWHYTLDHEPFKDRYFNEPVH